MKKTFIIILAAVLTAVLCISASAVQNSNHLIDEGFPRFNSDESEWDVFGWTVVDTKITAMGYKLDGADIVWVVDSVPTKDNASKVEPNDCFEDLELERAIIDMNLSNGLEEFYGYRIHVTLDSSKLAKGEHTLEVAVKYEDGSIGNPLRDSAIDIVKTKDAVEGGNDETKADETKADETKADETKADETKADETKAENPTTDAETKADTKPSNPKTSDTAIIAIASVAAVALAGVVIAKKAR